MNLLKFTRQVKNENDADYQQKQNGNMPPGVATKAKGTNIPVQIISAMLPGIMVTQVTKLIP